MAFYLGSPAAYDKRSFPIFPFSPALSSLTLVIRPGLDLSFGFFGFGRQLHVSGYSLPVEPNSMPNSDAFVVSAAAAFRSRAGTCLSPSLAISLALYRICVSAIAARYLRTQEQQQHNPGFQENINDNSKKKHKLRCRTTHRNSENRLGCTNPADGTTIPNWHCY